MDNSNESTTTENGGSILIIVIFLAVIFGVVVFACSVSFVMSTVASARAALPQPKQKTASEILRETREMPKDKDLVCPSVNMTQLEKEFRNIHLY